MQDVRVELLEETEPHLGRLGRHIEHDPRSRAFSYEAPMKTLRTVMHRRRIPILDQGSLGSCTGNAAVGALGTDPIFGKLPSTHPTLNEKEAVAVYKAATRLDGVAGVYPPTDTGSTGLGVAKACVAAKLIAGYTHTFSLNQLLQALMRQPVIIGINWYSSFDRPSAAGSISIRSGAYVRGGHEVVLDGYDASNVRVRGANSWSTSWGLNGRFYMSLKTLQRLLDESGDCTVFTPLK